MNDPIKSNLNLFAIYWWQSEFLFEIWRQNKAENYDLSLYLFTKNKGGKLQMTIQNQISSKEVKIGSSLISQTTVKKTLKQMTF